MVLANRTRLALICAGVAILLFGALVRDGVPPAQAVVSFTVTSTGDSSDVSPGNGVCDDGAGNCTLRAAIQEANALPGLNNIFFNISGGGVLQTISPTTPIPVVTEDVFLNGNSQVFPSTLPGIELSGSSCIDVVHSSGCLWGIGLAGGSSVVKGFVVNNFASGAGVGIGGPAATNTIRDSYIGTNTGGTAARPNGVGVLITASSFNHVYNDTVSGNSSIGIWITACYPAPLTGCADAGSNDVTFSQIGTSPGSSLAVGNGLGVLVDGSNPLYNVMNNVIGAAPSSGNTISGNAAEGVKMIGNATQNSVQANIIGTNGSISAALPNGGAGVCMCGASGNDIGPYTTIAGNGGAGVLIAGASNTRLGIANVGNNGTIAIPNGGAGVEIDGSSTAASGNAIGCVAAGCGIANAGNAGSGVYIHGALASGNTLESMSIGDYCTPDCLPPNDHPIPNGSHGVFITAGAHDNIIGPDATHGLDVAFNHGAGIALDGGPGNSVWAATTHENDGLGIDVTPLGLVTYQIDGAWASALFCPCNGGQLTLAGFSHGLQPLTAYPNIGVFLNASCDPSGYGENQFAIIGGSWYVPANAVTTDAQGNLSGAGSVTGVANSIGQYVTSFVVFPDHSTSELSRCLQVQSDNDGDGIQDSIDPSPSSFSSSFSDVTAGGTTSGTILDRGSSGTCYVSVTDDPTPGGVVLGNVCRTGGAPAHVSLCGGTFTVAIPDGGAVRERCGSLHNAVDIGPVTVTFGLPPYSAVLPSNTRVTLNDVGSGRFTVANDALSADTLTAGPPSQPVAPGNAITLHYNDADADGCPDATELALTPPTDPMNPWDFYSVPVPALFSAPDPTVVFSDNQVTPGDAQSVFAYFKKNAQIGSLEYEQDLNDNLVKDGLEYDRSIAGPSRSGPPDGFITPQDAQLAFGQFKFGYSC